MTTPSAAAVAPVSRADMADLAVYPRTVAIAEVRSDPNGIDVLWHDGRRNRFHALWLRDNCPCRRCRHPQTMERQFMFLDAPSAPVVRSAALTPAGDLSVAFGAAHEREAHASLFGAGWLRAHAYADWARAERAQPRELWDSRLANNVPTVAYADMMATDAGLKCWIESLHAYGIALLRDAPAEEGEILKIAGRIGPVRPTNFGSVYDVVSLPNPNNSAYTAIALEPHTDLANWHRPPDYQMLFCIRNEAIGGGSVLVDGFRVAEELRRVAPDDFDVLSQVEIDFRFHDDGCDIRHRAPTIALDRDGQIIGVRFNNWLRGALDVPEAMMERLYRALGRYWQMLRDPAFQLTFRLAAGEMIAFDNARVLHGREAFDPNTGRRHLQGCYLDRDLVDSRLRLIARRG